MNFRTSLRVFPIAALAAFAFVFGTESGFGPVASAQQQLAPAQSGGLQERVSQLEQRILELQSVIATLQTFANQGGGAQPSAAGLPTGGAGGAGGGPSELSIRVLALETQIRALTGQMEQLNRRLDGAGAPSGATPPLEPGAAPLQSGTAPLQPGVAPGAATVQPQGAVPYGTSPPALQQAAPALQERPPWQADPNARAPSPIPTPPQTAGLPPLQGESGTGARADYDRSYQSFLRNDLQSAEQGFRSFVESYPDDQLISNAYYWLGRTHLAKQQYEPAAKAFLAGYKKNKKGALAPDSLLHLGKSLAALGETEAACSTLKAVNAQYPNAPGELRQDVKAEMTRAGC